MNRRAKKYNPHKKAANPFVDFRFECVDKNTIMSFYNQIFWMLDQLKNGKSICHKITIVKDEQFSHVIALKRMFLETWSVIESLRERGIINPELVIEINWLREKINDIFIKMLGFVKFEDDQIEYSIHSDFSYKPAIATIWRMDSILNLMFNSWIGIKKHERAAARWNGCLFMGLYLEKENKALHKLLKFEKFKQELEDIFVKQRYLE